MKTFCSLLFLIFFISFGCSRSMVTVASDVKPEADFSEYMTYYWASHVQTDEAGIYFLNDLVIKETIKDAVQYEMNAKGYKLDETNPDLVVNFRVFEEPTEFTGYEQYNAAGYWGDSELMEMEEETYHFEEGTLLIDLVDREEGQIVWQGYASGIMDGEVFDKDPEQMKETVSLIFQEYDYRADDLGVGN